MKLRVKKDALKDYYFTHCGKTFDKDSVTEISNKELNRNVEYLIRKDVLEIIESEKINSSIKSSVTKQNLEDKKKDKKKEKKVEEKPSIKKEKIIDSPGETIKEEIKDGGFTY